MCAQYDVSGTVKEVGARRGRYTTSFEDVVVARQCLSQVVIADYYGAASRPDIFYCKCWWESRDGLGGGARETKARIRGAGGITSNDNVLQVWRAQRGDMAARIAAAGCGRLARRAGKGSIRGRPKGDGRRSEVYSSHSPARMQEARSTIIPVGDDRELRHPPGFSTMRRGRSGSSGVVNATVEYRHRVEVA